MTSKEDLGIKIGTKKEAWWTKVKNTIEEQLLENEEGQIILKNNLELAKKMIKVEENAH